MTASATGSTGGEEIKTGGINRWHTVAPWNDEMDPHKSIAQASWLFTFIGNTGVRLSQDATTVLPELFASWEQADDVTMVMKVQPGVTWHNGNVFTAEDAAYNLNRITGRLEPENQALYQRASTLNGMERAEAVDDETVRVTFSRPTSSFLGGLSDFRNQFIPADFLETGGSFLDPNTLIGTGPFIMDRFENEQRISFKRNPNFWKNGSHTTTNPVGADGAPYLDGVEVVWVPDNTSAVSAFAQGQIDYITNVSRVTRETIQQLNPNAREETWTFGNWQHWRFNTAREPYNDERVRRALFLVPRWEEISNEGFGEGYWDPTGPLAAAFTRDAISSDEIAKMPGWNPATKEADIQEAVRLMSAAGHDNPSFSLGILPSGSTGTAYEAAIRIQDQVTAVWPSLNLSLDLPADNSQFARGQVQGEFDTLIYGIFPQPDPVLELHSQYHSEGSRNYGRFTAPDVESLIDRAGEELDIDARQEHLLEVQDLLINKYMPLATFAMPRVNAWFNPYVKNMTDFGGRLDCGFMDVYRNTERMWLDK